MTRMSGCANIWTVMAIRMNIMSLKADIHGGTGGSICRISFRNFSDVMEFAYICAVIR